MKKRKIINYIEHCKYALSVIHVYESIHGREIKPYYFKKQIEVAEKLLKGMR